MNKPITIPEGPFDCLVAHPSFGSQWLNDCHIEDDYVIGYVWYDRLQTVFGINMEAFTLKPIEKACLCPATPCGCTFCERRPGHPDPRRSVYVMAHVPGVAPGLEIFIGTERYRELRKLFA